MMLFILGGAKKSKKEIDYTIREAMTGEDKVNQVLELFGETLYPKRINE